MAAGGVAFGQSNLIPGTDVSLAKMDTISAMGRTGVFPNGMNGVAMATTSCNKGTVDVPWEAAMLEDHPFIAFVVARETDGRLTQISDYSFVKHGFFALTDSFCDTCQEGPFGGGDFLGLGCSDTYGITNNGDQYWLAPPQEIDPWLGEWDATCSHFDMGEPAVGPPANCDGNRSLSTAMASALNPVGHRVNIPDSAFQEAGDFYYQGYYVVRGEPEDERENNWGTREFNPSWNGAKWNTPSVAGFIEGSVLNRWSGATVNSVKNGNSDGRIFVAVKVTGPVGGMYRYEYAVQNRDNFRGAGDISIPICSGATIENFGFSDVDTNAGNDWTATVNGASLDISVGSNPVRWNSFYNFWFDSDAAPVDGTMGIDQFDAGAGLGTLNLTTSTPQGLYNIYLGDGCSNGAGFPSLFATGSPAQATLGNPSFGIRSTGNQPSQPHLLVVGVNSGAIALGGGCTQWFSGTLGAGAFLIGSTTSNGSGVADYPLPIPSTPSFEGTSVALQAAGLNPGGGPIVGLFDLTNGLEVRIGDAVTPCP
ncbi:MAG: hypothetical protein AAF682_02415 [Planctomycetota bacterium]